MSRIRPVRCAVEGGHAARPRRPRRPGRRARAPRRPAARPRRPLTGAAAGGQVAAPRDALRRGGGRLVERARPRARASRRAAAAGRRRTGRAGRRSGAPPSARSSRPKASRSSTRASRESRSLCQASNASRSARPDGVGTTGARRTSSRAARGAGAQRVELLVQREPRRPARRPARAAGPASSRAVVRACLLHRSPTGGLQVCAARRRAHHRGRIRRRRVAVASARQVHPSGA